VVGVVLDESPACTFGEGAGERRFADAGRAGDYARAHAVIGSLC
jgi:hypothetical protein